MKSVTQLINLMSDISERCWHAGWMEGTEFVLWQAVSEGPLSWGQGKITEAEIVDLQRLAASLDGWIVWDDDTEETFIPMAQWLLLYSTHEKREEIAVPHDSGVDREES